MSGSELARYSMGDLADRLWLRRTISPGVAFARPSPRTEKDAAREEVVNCFSQRFYPRGLTLLTMPGLYWTFERELLRRREQRRMKKAKGLDRTFITGLESDEAIFRASFKFMPGVVYQEERGVAVLPSHPAATATVRTPLIVRYHRCEFEQYVGVDDSFQFDGAWLDFNGQMTIRRLDAIYRLWTTSLRSCLVVTGLNARTDAEVTARIHDAGGISKLLHNLCPGSRVIRSITYCDTTPMFQVTLVRPTPR